VSDAATILVTKREWHDLRAEVDRLRSLERRVADVKAALDGKTIVDAALVRRLL
jgi:4-diphosphocytidyl-2C-methyl-D-erythritol kinase